MNPSNRENPDLPQPSGFAKLRGLLSGIFKPKETPFATITYDGKKLDITDALPKQNPPEGEIEIPEGKPKTIIPEKPTDGPEVNIEEIPVEKPHRRKSDGSFDKKLETIDISWLERLLREGFRKMFTGLVGKPEIEIRQPKKITYKEAGIPENKICPIISAEAGDTVEATDGYVAIIKYESSYKPVNNGEKETVLEKARVVFIPEDMGYIFRKDDNLAFRNNGGKVEET